VFNSTPGCRQQSHPGYRPRRYAQQTHRRQPPAGRHPERPEQLSGKEASLLRQVLLPVQRRAVGDPVGDKGPDPSAATPQEVL